jgi:integrase/recombinase XerD
MTDNPFRRIPVSKERKTPTILTNEEKDQIFALIRHPEARLGFALARYAGLRRVEICRNVKWEGVDLKAGLLTIAEGKTGQDQIVPILPPLASILKTAQKPEGFIVTLGQPTLTHQIEHARREAGIHKPGAVRILRHSLAHGLLIQGVDIRVIQLLLRHSDISTTQIYTRIPADSIREMLAGKNV